MGESAISPERARRPLSGSRRALIAGALGVLGAVSALAVPTPAQAASTSSADRLVRRRFLLFGKNAVSADIAIRLAV